MEINSPVKQRGKLLLTLMKLELFQYVRNISGLSVVSELEAQETYSYECCIAYLAVIFRPAANGVLPTSLSS